jgi:hypothetical protein
MDSNCPESLVSVVTENGSGSEAKTSYDPVRGARGHLTTASASAEFVVAG